MRKGVKGGQLKILNEDQLYDIHLAILNILKHIGVRIKHEEALKILKNAGCDVNFNKYVVYFPEHLVEESVKKAPKVIRLCGRDKAQDIILEHEKVFFGNGVGVTHVYDIETGERRRAIAADMADATRLADALPNIDHAWGFFTASDVLPQVKGLYEQYVVMSNTMKHCVVLGHHGEKLTRDQVKIAELIAGGEEELKKDH